jgi:hypothetical protein
MSLIANLSGNVSGTVFLRRLLTNGLITSLRLYVESLIVVGRMTFTMVYDVRALFKL